MEWLDIVDRNGTPTGRIASREEAHEKGLQHRTSHVWILRRKNGELQVLLQKRSDTKDSFPGCYDISSAGHIPAGVDFIPSAIRELEEELGVTCAPGDLKYCGQRRICFDQVFFGKMFRDRQIANVYLLWLDREEKDFSLQKEEISGVRWFGFEDCLQSVRNSSLPNCIYEEELLMVKEASDRF